MSLRVALLRGINVGRSNRIKMDALRVVVEEAGGADVRTYIQSGNVVFRAKGRAKDLEAAIAVGVESKAGFVPRVVVLGAKAFREIADENPFHPKDPKTAHVYFLVGTSKTDDAALRALATKSERYLLTRRALYVLAPQGIGRSKLFARAESLLGVPATARNLRTVEAIVVLLDAG